MLAFGGEALCPYAATLNAAMLDQSNRSDMGSYGVVMEVYFTSLVRQDFTP